MTARALLQGHVRQGAWFAIAVDLENAGPTVTGELRVGGGAERRLPLRRPRRARDRVAQDLHPVRPAAVLRRPLKVQLVGR